LGGQAISVPLYSEQSERLGKRDVFRAQI